MKKLVLKSKQWLANRLSRQGRRVTRYPLAQYLRDFQIDCVLDVGANTGQFAEELRGLGYRGRIESFEPLPEVFAELSKNAARDPLWNVHPFALGAVAETRAINVSANAPSSSFLPMDSQVTTDVVDLSTVGTVNVEIRRLDDLFNQLRGTAKSVFLKIDTQGFERPVIEGGLRSLPQIALVQMELALVANYSGESLVEDMLQLMRGQGFDPWWAVDGFRNRKTLQLYQMDFIFAQRSPRG